MQLDPPRHLLAPDDAPFRRTDIFSRMGDVELLAELRSIRARASRCADAGTAEKAEELFTDFYDCRTHMRVPAWLWDTTRAFVRQHAA